MNGMQAWVLSCYASQMEPIEYTARLDSVVLALPVNTEMPSSSPVCEFVFMPEKTARPWWFVVVQSGNTANVERQTISENDHAAWDTG